MSFQQLSCATRIFHKRYPYFLLVQEWEEKRNHLAVYVSDLPNLVHDYKSILNQSYEANPRITKVDRIPEVRLASTCEAAANCLYSMAELSAQFGNKVSNGHFRASFNALRKDLESGRYSDDLVDRLGDLQWYRKVREIRTEWVHHSTIFIGEWENEPVMVVRSYRRPSDQQEFSSKIQVTVPELISWIQNAVRTIDAYGDYLLEKHIVPSFPLNDQLLIPKYDRGGLPIFLSDNRFDVEQITVREYLTRCGLSIT